MNVYLGLNTHTGNLLLNACSLWYIDAVENIIYQTLR
jgi:hypothetical protein